MKKTFYMNTFNPIVKLMFLLGFSAVLTILVKFLHIEMSEIAALPANVPSIFNQFMTDLNLFNLILFLFLVVLIGANMAWFITQDSLLNYVKSDHQSFKLRHFLRQRERTEQTAEREHLTSFNPINAAFNRTMSKAVIHVMKDEILVYIKIPKTQQAQKILKEMENQIKTEISSQNPDYIFSGFERQKHQLWLKGTRKF